MLLSLTADAVVPEEWIVPSGTVVLVNASIPPGHEAWGAFCSGFAISETVIVTARHCLRGREAGDIAVLPRPERLCSDDRLDRVSVSDVALPGDAGLDIAFLTVVGALPAPTSVSGQLPSGGDTLHTASWASATSRARSGCPSITLELLSVEDSECTGLGFPRSADAEYFCATGSEGRNTCGGDSGGAVWSAGRPTQIVGMTLGGAGCRPDDPGQFVSIETIRHALDTLDGAGR